jgi:hypothetical protein
MNKIRVGVLETENLNQQIFHKNPNLVNWGNRKLGDKKGFLTELSSPHVGPMVGPTNNSNTFADIFPSNPTIPVRNCDTPFYDEDNHRNSMSTQAYQQTSQAYQQTSQAYQQTSQAYQQTSQAYQPQYQESVYAQPQSYAPEAYQYYYDSDYPTEESSAQYGSQNSQDQSQLQQECYYTEDYYMVPGNYDGATQSDRQITYLATQPDVYSYPNGYQIYPSQTAQLPNYQCSLPQGYVTPTQQNGYPVQGQYISY